MNNMNGFATDTAAKRGKGLIVATIVLLLLATPKGQETRSFATNDKAQ